jgi:hypothetical protein
VADSHFPASIQKGQHMNKSIFTAVAAALALAGCDSGTRESILLAETTVTGNITQSQSGSGNNSQSISIGNTDGSAAAKKGKKASKVSSTQDDPETGNKQSANVSGSAKVKQSQGGRDNTQSANVDGSGNISQNQSGRNNSQSLVIGGNSAGGTPSITQSQTGANRKQSIKIDGKKVETKEE